MDYEASAHFNTNLDDIIEVLEQRFWFMVADETRINEDHIGTAHIPVRSDNNTTGILQIRPVYFVPDLRQCLLSTPVFQRDQNHIVILLGSVTYLHLKSQHQTFSI